MILSAVSLLPDQPETRTWYRVAGPAYLRSGIATAHTSVTPSRFYDPYTATPQFASLYLADNSFVAMFEAQALFGSPLTPGGIVPAPAGAWVVLTVRVQLDAVVDLASQASQAVLGTTAQELTGDWRGYRTRSHLTPVSGPVGVAPTQLLGEAIFRDARSLEGLLSVSAKLPQHRSLVVFPGHLRPGSFVEYEWDDGPVKHLYRIDGGNPNGVLLR